MPTIGVVITAFDQAGMVEEAVNSARAQTRQPDQIVVVDDGSRDPDSVQVLAHLSTSPDVEVLHQANTGVSAARNRGIGHCHCDRVLVLDGDDRIVPTFLERTSALLDEDPDAVGASSWMRMFGLAHALVRPPGGAAVDFLARNACPATVLLQRSAWVRAGGYEEGMRRGFEDWDFFLSVLDEGGHISIVPEALIEYRTSADSANVTSMGGRSELVSTLVERHHDLYHRHLREAVVALDAISSGHLQAWEALAVRQPDLDVPEASFGDGGMAALVRVESARASRPKD
ncbi:MAG: glycosyltransferase family 2 protein [Pauljensenia sp.]